MGFALFTEGRLSRIFTMINNKIKGNNGEVIAAKYLVDNGYEIVEKNFRTDVGEIDIIAAGEGYLVFVEVKERFSDKYGYAADAVGFRKQNKISQVASQFIVKRRYFDLSVRFDVIEVYFDEKRVEHIKNAFDSFVRY